MSSSVPPSTPSSVSTALPPMSSTCWYTDSVSLGSVCPSRYMARRGLTSHSARIDAKVRRSVCGVTCGIGVCPRARSSSCATATAGSRTRCATLLAVCGVPALVRNAARSAVSALVPELCARVDEDLAQRGHRWDGALAGVRLRLRALVLVVARRDDDPPGGEVDAVLEEATQLADTRAGEDQRSDDREPLRPLPGGLLGPHEPATDLADEHVADAELPLERRVALVRPADVLDLVPVHRALAAVELARAVKQRGDVVRLEERPLRRRHLQVNVPV